jgi:hypothetical protein
MYSSSWLNNSSLAVAHKLGLHAFASNWSIDDQRFTDVPGAPSSHPAK